MRVASLNTRCTHPVNQSACGHQQITDPITRQVPTFEQYRFCSHSQQLLRRNCHGLLAVKGSAHKQSSLIQIRRYQRNPVKQLSHQRSNRWVISQNSATGGHHHGIEHNIFQSVVVNCLGDNPHNIRRGQHADFHGINADILYYGINLVSEYVGGNPVNSANSHRVLRCQCRDGGHAKAAKCGDGFQISLNTSTAATIRAGDT